MKTHHNNPTGGNTLLVNAGAKAAAGSASCTPLANKRSTLTGQFALFVWAFRGRSERGPVAADASQHRGDTAGALRPCPPAVPAACQQLASSYPGVSQQLASSYLIASPKLDHSYLIATPQQGRRGSAASAGPGRPSTGRVVT